MEPPDTLEFYEEEIAAARQSALKQRESQARHGADKGSVKKESYIGVGDPTDTPLSKLGENAAYLVFHRVVAPASVDDIVRGWFPLANQGIEQKKIEFYTAFWGTLRTMLESGERRGAREY